MRPHTIVPVPEAINYGLPSQLVIPRLDIKARISYMGLNENGSMQAPDNVHDVGWYKYGSLPGNKGNAVIAGHLDGLKGEPGVFAALGSMQKGDNITIVDTKGQDIIFVVREIRVYRHDERLEKVFGTVDGTHLNLITCAGAWDKDRRHFTERLVVFADQVI